MKQRLEQFLAAENLTKSQFADSINVARAAITHIIAGRNNPSYEFIINTMAAYPDLNIEWLLRGKGKMYKSEPSTETEYKPKPVSYTEDNLFFQPQEDIKPEIEEQEPVKEKVTAISGVQKTRIEKIIVFFDDDTYQEFC